MAAITPTRNSRDQRHATCPSCSQQDSPDPRQPDRNCQGSRRRIYAPHHLSLVYEGRASPRFWVSVEYRTICRQRPRLLAGIGYLDVDAERRELGTAIDRDLDLFGVHDVPADHRKDLLAQHREHVDLTS